MRIPVFSLNIKQNELTPIELKDCPLVIDAQNFFYRTYVDSRLPFEFGCESDKYAEYLRKTLTIFKQANIQCYFVFKGGHENFDKREEKHKDPKTKTYAHPCFMKDVYIEVLEEMDFNYVFCELEAKRDCIALAQQLKCPIMSFDIEFCFSGVPYIPKPCEEHLDMHRSEVFHLDKFLKKYSLSKEHLCTFIILTDITIFPENKFARLFKALRLPTSNLHKNQKLLEWLSKTPNEQACTKIFNFLSLDDKKKFLLEKSNLLQFICRDEIVGVPGKYLLNGNSIGFDTEDPLWFQKGVACGHIALPYINLYRWHKIFGSWCVEDDDSEDSMLLSIDIIKYAHNLLTNFNGIDEIVLIDKRNEEHIFVPDVVTISKPFYDHNESPFENGWGEVKTMKLFEHFVEESMPGFNYQALRNLPEDARLLILALVYFSRRKGGAVVTCEVYSVLLSYVMLGVVGNVEDGNNNTDVLSNRPLLDSTIDKDCVLDTDCEIARKAMRKYFETTESKTKHTFDSKLVHPLVEFQHCLHHLNYLNKLCGSSFKDTIYSKTYNGTFVYQVLYTIKHEYNGNAQDFLKKELSCAATVLALLNGLFETFEEVMYR